MSQNTLQLFENMDNPSAYALVERTEIDWGDPTRNLDQLLKYNLCPEFDSAVYGLDMEMGEYIILQGEEKNRKTTFLLNLVYEFGKQLKQKGKWACIDVLESGMTPSAYRDGLITIVATKYMISKYFGGDRYRWPNPDEIVTHEEIKKELILTRKFLRYGRRTPFQVEAIEFAKKVVGSLPLTIFGAAKKEGMARRYKLNMERWQLLYEGKFPNLEGCEHFLFITDNVQQFTGFDSNSYGNLGDTVGGHGDFAAENRVVVWDVHQVSKSSKESGELMARGGKRGNEECNYAYETSYREDENPFWITLKTPRSRETPPPTLRIPIEPNSGAILGKAIVYENQ